MTQSTIPTSSKTCPQTQESYNALLKVSERELARKDPLWLLESKYLYIKTKDGGIIPLVPNYAQRRLLNAYKSLVEKGVPPRIIILKARQLGMSTCSEAIIFALTHIQEGIDSGIMADTIPKGSTLLDMIKLFHDRLPSYIKVPEKRSNEKKLGFENLSNIFVETAQDPTAGRSHTYRYVHFSEVALYPSNIINNMLSGIMNAIPKTTDSLVIMESTANGFGNYFYEAWNNAEQGKNEWYPLFIPWFEDPSYVLKPAVGFELSQEEKEYKKDILLNAKVELNDDRMYWRRFVIYNELNADTELFKQEYPAYPAQAFLVSGRPRFNVKTLMELKKQAQTPKREEGYWSIWEDPQPNTAYIMGVDSAGGKSDGNNSVAQILDPVKLEVVAKFRGKIEPDAFGHELEIWGRKYNTAHMIIEVNNHGLTTLNTIKTSYPNIYWKKDYGQKGTIWTKQLGWLTTTRTRPMMIDNLSVALEDGLRIWCRETIDELFTFIVDEKGKPVAEQGKFDDEVIALALANQARLEGFWEVEAEKEERIPEEGSLIALLDLDKRNKKKKFRSE